MFRKRLENLQMPSVQLPQDKFTLVCKPEQSGKTFIMIQEIIKYLTIDEEELEGKIVVNIIFCDNNLLLTKQTSVRIDNDLRQYSHNGETYVEFSSRKGNETRNAAAAMNAIAVRGIRNLICCTNGKRMQDISKVVADLNSSPIVGEKFIFRVWLDEADKFIKHISNTFIPVANKHENVHISMLTATPETLFKKYKEMDVFPLHETVTPNYHGWKDNNIVKLENSTGSCEMFISEVLTDNRHLIQPGTKWYIPAERKKTSHDAVKMLCVGAGMAVFIVNGDGLTLERPNMEPITEEKNEELNKLIMKMYVRYGLDKFAVVITGNICVGRGISIMSPEFIFDYGIISSCRKKAEASQSAGRLKGNIKAWSNYKSMTVFTTEKFDTVATEWEEKSRRLAILANDHHEAGGTTVITQSEFKNINNKCEYVVHPDLFDTFQEILDFLKRTEIMANMGDVSPSRPQKMKPAIRTQCGGYAVCTRLPRGNRKITDITSEDRLTITEADEIIGSMCISGGSEKTCKVLVIPVYRTRETPADQEKYQLRYRIKRT